MRHVLWCFFVQGRRLVEIFFFSRKLFSSACAMSCKDTSYHLFTRREFKEEEEVKEDNKG